MAVDKNKIIAEATRLVQKGQYDKALKAYEKILAEDRKEVRVLLKVGEIQQKKGEAAAAAATFNQVAEIYGEQGFFLKAVAVYKQIAKLAPDDVRVNEKLAALYQQLGLLNDATTQLQVVATAYERSGDQGRHLDVLRRLLDLDPENVVTCQRLGDLYARANRTAEALELYRRAATHLRENRRSDEYLKVAERIQQLTPDDLKLARELAQEYLARGETKKALGKLQVCHGADKQDVETLRLMAQAFRDLGQVSKTIAVYRALARVYADRGRREDAAVTWRMVQELLPDDTEARDELAALAGPAAVPAGAPPGPPVGPPPGVRPVAAPRAGPPPGALRTPPGSPATTPHPAPAVRAASPAPPQVAPPPAAPPPPATLASIERVLTEADVYVKYGLHKKALEHLQKLLASDPENPDALERVRDVQDALGDRQGAAEAAERVVQVLLARGAEGRIDHAIERLRQLDPSHAEMEAGGAEPLPPPEPEAPALSPGVAPSEPEAIVVPVPEEETFAGAQHAPPVEAPAPDEPALVLDVPRVADDVLEPAPPASVEPGPADAFPPGEEAPRRVPAEEGPIPLLDDEMPPAVAALLADEALGALARPEPHAGPPPGPESPGPESPEGARPGAEDEFPDIELQFDDEPPVAAGPGATEGEPLAVAPETAPELLPEPAPVQEAEPVQDPEPVGEPAAEEVREVQPEELPQPAAEAPAAGEEIPVELAETEPPAVEEPQAFAEPTPLPELPVEVAPDLAPEVPPAALVPEATPELDEPIAVDEPVSVEAASPAEPVEPPVAEPEPVEIEEAEIEPVDDGELASTGEEPGEAGPPPLPAVPPPLPERPFPSLDAEMEEISFYERHGLLEEALLAVQDLATAHPGHPAVEAALARLTRRATSDGTEALPQPDDAVEAPVVPSGDAPPQEAPRGPLVTGITGIFDLGAELSAELGPDVAPTPSGEFQYSVADVFDQFKRGLEKTVRPDDTATKYDLGIAFQEMGMLDEALEQFRSALAGGERKREVDILSMIGTCLGMKGQHREAIESYRQALRSEFLTGEGAKALHFELGAAHEALGEPEVALWYFQKIARGDPGYRGVLDRVVRLGGGPGTPPADGGRPLAPAAPQPGDEAAPPARRRPGKKNAGRS